jgi:predicted nucleic-acid-binding Zn-ribbon protein
MECVRCGATAVVEGSVMDTGGGGGVAFLFKDISMLKSIFGVGSRKISAHACVHCSHLELTVEFTEKDRKRYQEFDGPQPGVIERVNSEQ